MSKLQRFCNHDSKKPLEKDSNLEEQESQHNSSGVSDSERAKDTGIRELSSIDSRFTIRTRSSSLPSRSHCAAPISPTSASFTNCATQSGVVKPTMCELMSKLRELLHYKDPEIREHIECCNVSVKSMPETCCNKRWDYKTATGVGFSDKVRDSQRIKGGSDALKHGMYYRSRNTSTSPVRQQKDVHVKPESAASNQTKFVRGFQKHVERIQKAVYKGSLNWDY